MQLSAKAGGLIPSTTHTQTHSRQETCCKGLKCVDSSAPVVQQCAVQLSGRMFTTALFRIADCCKQAGGLA